jgi:hypothetical protein
MEATSSGFSTTSTVIPLPGMQDTRTKACLDDGMRFLPGRGSVGRHLISCDCGYWLGSSDWEAMIQTRPKRMVCARGMG